jgi:probable selenium-dependent hydroxylase accessory protein YqeC
VEADGSARKPFKAPAAHEPVIPVATTLVVAVVGADAFGRPLSAEVAHRPELVAEQAGIRLGDPLTPEAVARVLLGPANLRGKPAGARLAALITGARTPVLRDAAERLARLLRDGGASPVILAELVAAPGFIERVA